MFLYTSQKDATAIRARALSYVEVRVRFDIKRRTASGCQVFFISSEQLEITISCNCVRDRGDILAAQQEIKPIARPAFSGEVTPKNLKRKAYNLQPTTYNLQPTTYNLQLTTLNYSSFCPIIIKNAFKNSSILPFITPSTSLVSNPVRTSFTNLYGCMT